MAEKKWMIDLPNPHTPGAFCDKGPMTEDEARSYLDHWGLAKHFEVFATELNQEKAEDAAPWVLKYEHRHGVDETVYATEELANKGACHLIVSWWGDVDDRDSRAEIAKKLAEKDWVGAREAWNDYQEWAEDKHGGTREFLTIEQQGRVVTEVPDPEPPAEDASGVGEGEDAD